MSWVSEERAALARDIDRELLRAEEQHDDERERNLVDARRAMFEELSEDPFVDHERTERRALGI